ncbi:sugar ABC transporter permease [Lachnoclostridium pacaense]|uniref:carbohydrate ABC transporter permease n=1 Tax=Enterocloster hominis (ex Hitch et al. 2024) TaxID=1917870 RepID=UPI001D111C75|nr:sugar ABC transporter permease [Lachnoclostridium pacaense]MCC2876062.1 sugar ABC transporter permease [Lachnoclostridium pacaense]
MRRTKRICISRNRKAWLFLAPSLAGTAVFILIPFADMVARSFRQAVGGRFVGLANFRLVLESRAFLLAALNTLRFILVCIPALMAFSLCTAVMIQSCSGHASPSGRGGNVYKTSILLPMAIPVASVVLLWKLLFYPQGLLGQLAGLVGLAGQDWLNQPSAFGILVVTYIWKNTGYDMMLWLAGLNAIPQELHEAARVDGAGPWQCFCFITLPGLKGTAFLTAVLSIINSFKVFREAYLVAGDYPHESIYMLQHLFNNWFVSLDIQKMSAASVLVEAAVLIPVLVCAGVFRRRYAERSLDD